MNTIGATTALWGERLRAHIVRLGRWVSGRSVAKKQQETEDGFPVIHLSEKAKKRLAKISDEIDAGIDMSPTFETAEEMDAWLDAPDTDRSGP